MSAPEPYQIVSKTGRLFFRIDPYTNDEALAVCNEMEQLGRELIRSAQALSAAFKRGEA